MALKARITDDMKAALLGGDRFVGNVLRDLKAAILNEEVTQGKRDAGLPDGEVEAIIVREVKKRNDSIRMYTDNDRQDLAENEQKEVAVLQEYLPKQLTEAEIQVLVDEAIAATGAADMKAMGAVVGAVKAKAGSSVDGKTLADIVKRTLSN